MDRNIYALAIGVLGYKGHKLMYLTIASKSSTKCGNWCDDKA